MRDVFLHGDYAALPAGEHVIAFIRTTSERSAIVCVPRFARRLTRGERPWPVGDAWGNQTILVPAGRFRDAFTDRELVTQGTLRLAECFESFPLALLIGTTGAPAKSSPKPSKNGTSRD